MRPILGQKGWRILLSDPDGKVAQLFEVWDLNRKRARRVAFLIDPNGIVCVVDEQVHGRTHGSDVLKNPSTMARTRQPLTAWIFRKLA